MQQKNKPYPGMFITIEGGEGAGKSTLSEKLTAHLQSKGFSVVRTREPGGTPLSEKLRKLLLDPGVKLGERAELLLFLAARAEHIEEVILPALRQGKVVVCERFHDSTIAYQGCARHLGTHLVEELCQLSSDYLNPDVTLFLDLDPALGLKRAGEIRGTQPDRVEQEKMQFHNEVRQGFLHLADKYSNRIVVIDAAAPFEKVLQESIAAIAPHCTLKPV